MSGYIMTPVPCYDMRNDENDIAISYDECGNEITMSIGDEKYYFSEDTADTFVEVFSRIKAGKSVRSGILIIEPDTEGLRIVPDSLRFSDGRREFNNELAHFLIRDDKVLLDEVRFSKLPIGVSLVETKVNVAFEVEGRDYARTKVQTLTFSINVDR